MCEAVSISVNRNSVPGDKSALSPGGVRVGTPAMTTRGMKEADFVVVASAFFGTGFGEECLSQLNVIIGDSEAVEHTFGETVYFQDLRQLRAEVAGFLDRCSKLAVAIQEKHGKKLVDFEKNIEGFPGVKELRAEVTESARAHSYYSS